MPRRWRRKFSALFDNVLESGLSCGQVGSLVLLQAVLHRAWRTDPERYEAWAHGDAEKILTLAELQEVSRIASLGKARRKLLGLAGCDLYGIGPLEVTVCPSPGLTASRSGCGRGARLDAQTVKVRWPKFSEVLNLRGPDRRSDEGSARPYEGRGTKYEARGGRPAPVGALIGQLVQGVVSGAPPYGRRVVEGNRSPQLQPSSPGWDVPADTPRISELSANDHEEMRRATAEAKRTLRERSQKP